MKFETRYAGCLLMCCWLILLTAACGPRRPSGDEDYPEPSFENDTAIADRKTPSVPAPPIRIPTTPCPPGWPAAFVAEPAFDFGEVVDGAQVRHEFVIQNPGDAPLEISNVTTGCACAVPEFPRSISPGQSGKIRITIDTDGYGGNDFTRPIVVSTNVPDISILELMITGRVQPFVKVNPRALMLKGPAKGKVSAVATITPNPRLSFVITDVLLDDNLKEAVSIDIDRKGGYFVLTATNRLRSPGQYLGKIILKTDSLIKPEIKIFIHGAIH